MKRNTGKIGPLIVVGLLVAMISAGVLLSIRNKNRRQLVESSPIGQLCDQIAAHAGAINAELWMDLRLEKTCGELKEPWILVLGDEEDGWTCLYTSEGNVNEENLKKARTIVWAQSGFETQRYIMYLNGAQITPVNGRTQYYSFYCIDVETGAVYVPEEGAGLRMDILEAQDFPERTSTTEDLTYEDDDVYRYVKKHFSDWKTRSVETGS